MTTMINDVRPMYDELPEECLTVLWKFYGPEKSQAIYNELLRLPYPLQTSSDGLGFRGLDLKPFEKPPIPRESLSDPPKARTPTPKSSFEKNLKGMYNRPPKRSRDSSTAASSAALAFVCAVSSSACKSSNRLAIESSLSSASARREFFASSSARFAASISDSSEAIFS